MCPPHQPEDAATRRAQGVCAPEGVGPAWAQEQIEAVLRYAARRLPLADAEDVVGEACLALLEAQRDGRAPAAPGAYLFGVARRRIADRRRRAARGLEPDALPAGWEGFCDMPLPEEALASRELAELLAIAVGLLEPEARALVEARYRGGEPVAALALRLGVTPKAVEGRLARARGALRGLLHEVGGAWREVEPPTRPADSRGEPR